VLASASIDRAQLLIHTKPSPDLYQPDVSKKGSLSEWML
jgi:hypothetical protein